MERRKSRKIKLGNTTLGGDSPVLVQSMLNVPSTNIDGSVAQAKALAAAGCQVIRFAIPDEAALDLIEPIKNAVDVPLVADIHFNYRLTTRQRWPAPTLVWTRSASTRATSAATIG